MKLHMYEIRDLLEKSAARHTHLCPRQVLGVRAGLAGVTALGMSLPCTDKRLLVILETDGCFADGVEVATGCTVGHRTLRVEDYGKIAATFINLILGTALRVAPRLDVRQRAFEFVPNENRRYFAQLQAYQVMPDEELFSIQEVHLNKPLEKILSHLGVRVNCDACGEEIINEREIRRNDIILCLPCAGQAYYSAMRYRGFDETFLSRATTRINETTA